MTTDRDPARESIYEYKDRVAKDKDREFWLQIRQALLMVADAIERVKLPDIQPRTSVLRKDAKSTRRE